MTRRHQPIGRRSRSSAAEESTHAANDDGARGDEEVFSDEEEEEVDEFDVDEELEMHGILRLASLRGQAAAAEGEGEENDEEFEGEEGAAEEEEEELILPHRTDEWRRERARKGVEARRDRAQRQAAKKARAPSGRFCGAQGDNEVGGQPRRGLRKRDRDYERRERERERLRDKRAQATQQRQQQLRDTFEKLSKFHLTGKVDYLIHTNEERFRAKGLEEKLKDFGRGTDLAPYRARASALYQWHRLVLEEGMGWCNAYAVVAKTTGKTAKTISQWVRGFHALGGKINRLLTGLHQKTPSYLDDRDLVADATAYIDLKICQRRRAERARKLAAAANKDRLLAQQLKKKAEDTVNAAATATQATASTDAQAATQEAEETQVEDVDDDIICTCKQPGGGAATMYCESCDEHFHLDCVGIEPRAGRILNRSKEAWKCPSCVTAAEHNATVEQAEAVLRGRDPIGRASEAQAAQAEDPEEEFTGRVFHRWVNETLLTDIIANGGKPISLRTARNWLHKLGYRWRARKRITYMDGHEREDVKE